MSGLPVIRQLSGTVRYLCLTVVVLASPVAAPAQDSAYVPPPSAPIQWWHGLVAVGGLTAITLLDEPTQRYAQDHRTTTKDDLARGFKHFGQPEVYGTVTLGLVAGGLLSGKHEVTRAGARLAASLLLAGGTSTVAKYIFGRARPSETLDAYDFEPFSGQDAMPSGHTTMAFTLATALSDDIRNPFASVGLYTVATGVGWSRINDNRHWLSDVCAGALVGITSAKLVNGRWRLFNLRPPQVLLGPRQAEIAWQSSF